MDRAHCNAEKKAVTITEVTFLQLKNKLKMYRSLRKLCFPYGMTINKRIPLNNNIRLTSMYLHVSHLIGAIKITSKPSPKLKQDN